MTAATSTGRARRIVIRALVLAALVAAVLVGLLVVALRRPDAREADLLMTALAVGVGATVGEIGAGDGWLSVEVARRVGPSGRVYSTELGDDQLDRIRATASRGGVSNVTVLQAGERSTNLRTACCDAVFMRRVYHHLPDPPAIVSDLLRALKPGGRLVIIEFERSGLLGTITREGVDRADLVAEVTTGGFDLVAVTEWPGTSHYVAVFRKAGDGEP